MGNKTSINPKQLFSFMILFEFGTAIVVPIGLQAKHANWLAILAALPGGILLFLIYNYLFKQYPDQIISGYSRKIAGPFIAWLICLFIVGYFIYNGARMLREAGDLLVTSIYDQTPMMIINSMMIFTMIYVLRKGVEVLFRLAQIYFFVIMLTGIAGAAVVIFSGEMDIRNILPLNGGSWLSVFQAAYPSILVFPYGELFCFTTVLPMLSHKRQSGRIGIAALGLSGLLLAVTHAFQIMLLGDSIYARSTFSLLTAISIVDIANFLQRLDALVVLTLIICVFFKMSMYCFAVMAILGDLFNLSSPEKLAAPVGIVVLFLSIFSAWSSPEHTSEGQLASIPLLIVVTIAIPLFLFLMHFVKKAVTHLSKRG